MRRRWRLTLLVLGGLALAAALAAVLAVYLLLRPERFTAMLQAQARDAGLELNLARPASPTLFPRPALDLDGITINARNASTPILLAARGQLVLPWRTLMGGPTVISRLEIDAPRVDLLALQSWLAALPPQPQSAPTNIPRIDTGVSIVRGSIVRGDELLLGNVSLDAGSLMSDRPFPLDLTATTAAGLPLQLYLRATPRIRGNALQLDDVSLHLAGGEALTLVLNGSARWHGANDAAADLRGTLDKPNTGQYRVSIALTPADQTDPLLLILKLDGPDNHADLRLPPLALAHWWSQFSEANAPGLSVPPANGHLELSQLQAGGVTIEGLTLDAGDHAAPAASSTAPRRAAAAPTLPKQKP